MAITVTVEINDLNQKILLNALLDIDAWVKAAATGKINKCSKRMAEQAKRVLKADASVETMPATDNGLIEALLARSDYKNRAARDSE